MNHTFTPNPYPDNLPFVSILVAARNEEANIVTCLAAIDRLTYPKDRMEVLIGNDASDDKTAQLATRFIADKNYARLINIDTKWGSAQGKSNVLAQLTFAAQGDFFFFTDADIQVPQNWIQTMLASCQADTGVVTGVTIATGSSLFAKLQAIDWATSIYALAILAGYNRPVTAMGNNMMTSRNAYFATGGYEKLPFSVTEDYQLFKAILAKGYGFKQLYSRDALALSQPIETISGWLKQRNRWMRGAMNLPLYLRLIFFLQLLFYPLVILLAVTHHPILALWLWLAKTTAQVSFIRGLLTKLNQQHLKPYIPLFDFYFNGLNMLLFIYQLLPNTVEWKGRKYT